MRPGGRRPLRRRREQPARHPARELARRLHDLVAAGAHEAAGRLLNEDLLDRFAFAGTPDQVAARAAALFAAGAHRVEFGPPFSPRGIAAGIELLGRKVIRNIRG